MPLLLSPWKRTNHRPVEEPALEAGPVEIKRPDPATAVDRLLVLRPTEGGLAFRMYGFPDFAPAMEYVDRHLWLEAQQGLRAFWAMHRPPQLPDTPSDAVVIVRDPYHPGVVQVYSFIDMDAAMEFVRQEFRSGIDLNLILVFWAYYVEIDVPHKLAPDQSPDRAFFATPTLDRHLTDLPSTTKPSATVSPKAESGTAPASADAPQDGASAEDADESETPPSWLSQTYLRIISWPGWDGLIPHVVRAARLDADVYAAVEQDRYATGRARLLIGLAVFAAGFGTLESGVVSAFWQTLFALAGWTAAIGATYAFSTTVVVARSRPGAFRRLVQTLGLAASPALLLVFGIIPVYGAIVVLGVYVWLFLTVFHAVSSALELDDQSSVVTAAVCVLTLFALAQVAPLVLV